MLSKKWDEAEFATLDPEEITATTMKYLKSVTQLEKGLLPNDIVPRLRQKVDDMRSIVGQVFSLNLRSI